MTSIRVIRNLDGLKYALSQLGGENWESYSPEDLQEIWLYLRDCRETQRGLMDKIVAVKTKKLFPDGHIVLHIDPIESEERVNIT